MFRNRGLHPRTTEPGTVAPRFSRANTNVPLWSGDHATRAAAPAKDNINESQRVASRIAITAKQAPKNVGLFFVAKARPASAGAGGRPMSASASMSNNNNSTNPLALEDQLSHSRRGLPPTEGRTHRASLRPGEFVPALEVSIRRRLGKKPSDTIRQTTDEQQSYGKRTNGGPAPADEFQHLGKKAFPQRMTTSVSSAAPDIGEPQRTELPASPDRLRHSRRFEQSKRHASNLEPGLVASDAAPTKEFENETRRKHAETVPGNRAGKTLEYVFEPPVKKVNASYRPVAPWE
jgi:hypothetical protein